MVTGRKSAGERLASLPKDQRRSEKANPLKNIGIISFAEYIKALFRSISDFTLTVFESLDHQKDSHEQDKD